MLLNFCSFFCCKLKSQRREREADEAGGGLERKQAKGEEGEEEKGQGKQKEDG